MPEQETREERWPHLVERGPVRDLKLQVAQFGLLFSSMHMFRRTATACLMQFFQQMSGIDCIVSNRHLSDSDPSPLDGFTKCYLISTDLLCAHDLWWSRSSRQDDVVAGFRSRGRSVSTTESEVVRDRDTADLGWLLP